MIKKQSKGKRAVSVVLWWILMSACSVLFLLPFVWMALTAFKTAPQTVAYPIEWIPNPWTIRAFVEGLQTGGFEYFFFNSAFITVMCIIGTVASGALVAFGFARLNARSKNFLFTVLLATMMIPGTVTLIPMFVLYSKLKWVDTFIPLILPAFLGGGAFNIFLLRQFFASIPKELAESAMLDGCSWFRIFWNIYLPNAKPSLLVVTMFTFVGTWNDYFSPMIYLVNPKKFTIAIGLATFKNQYGGAQDIGPMMAMSLLTVLPVLLLYLLCQKYFVEGVVTSGMKG